MKLKYKNYWRKSGLKGKWGDIYLKHLDKFKPKHFLEIGVFCGVNAKNTCEYLNKLNDGKFSYIGIDLFGSKRKDNTDEVEPSFLKNQNFSNPLKRIYYNYILRENLNSLKSNQKFLKKFEKNVKLIAGDTNDILRSINISKVDYAFVDGGHSYKTTLNDLKHIYANMKGKKGTIVCDDYQDASYITEVKKAIDDYVKKESLSLRIIEGKFAVIDI